MLMHLIIVFAIAYYAFWSIVGLAILIYYGLMPEDPEEVIVDDEALWEACGKPGPIYLEDFIISPKGYKLDHSHIQTFRR